jgi:hypothetical protein
LVASPAMESLSIASLNMGSLSFGIVPLKQKYDNWKFDWELEFLDITCFEAEWSVRTPSAVFDDGSEHGR